MIQEVNCRVLTYEWIVEDVWEGRFTQLSYRVDRCFGQVLIRDGVLGGAGVGSL